MRTNYYDQDGAQGGKNEFSKGCKREKYNTLSLSDGEKKWALISQQKS